MDWEAILRADGRVARGSDLRAAGLSRHTLLTRVRTGAWQRVLPNVVIAHSGQSSMWERRKAATLYAGDGSVLSHRSAAALHGLGPPEPLVEVTIRHGGHVRSRDFVLVHQSARPCATTFREGIPCTPVVRTIVDLACAGRRLDDVRALVSRAVQSRTVSVEELCAEYDLAPRQGSGFLRTVLDEVATGSRSVAESLFLRLVKDAHLPMPLLNAPVVTRGGTFNVDALWRKQRLIVEIDGAAWHLDALSWRRDLWRQNLLLTAGYRVLRFPVLRLREDAPAVILEVQTALRLAA